tara:strand:+ start:225 stop:353 length:129 start_codon:yes stop_codon:yes gene_type:complete
MRIVIEQDRGMWAWCGDMWHSLAPWQSNIDIELFCLLTGVVI